MNSFNGYENTVGQVGTILFKHGNEYIELITVKKAAELYRRSERTIQRYIESGQLIAINLAGIWLVEVAKFSSDAETLDDIPY